MLETIQKPASLFCKKILFFCKIFFGVRFHRSRYQLTLATVVDEEFQPNPNFNFLTNQPNEPSGNNSYNVITLLINSWSPCVSPICTSQCELASRGRETCPSRPHQKTCWCSQPFKNQQLWPAEVWWQKVAEGRQGKSFSDCRSAVKYIRLSDPLILPLFSKSWVIILCQCFPMKTHCSFFVTKLFWLILKFSSCAPPKGKVFLALTPSVSILNPTKRH